jgi:hypothetical protein
MADESPTPPESKPEAGAPAVADDRPTLEQWCIEHRVPHAHRQHLLHHHQQRKLTLSTKATPEEFAALLDATFKARL